MAVLARPEQTDQPLLYFLRRCEHHVTDTHSIGMPEDPLGLLGLEHLPNGVRVGARIRVIGKVRGLSTCHAVCACV